jgi:hypothetical protein
MSTENKSDLERLQRQVERAKKLIHQSEKKVEELGASISNICDLKDRFVIFPRNMKRNSGDRADVPPAGKLFPFKAA